LLIENPMGKNINLTLSDRRLGDDTEVLTASNYYPFGMQQQRNSYAPGITGLGLTARKWIRTLAMAQAIFTTMASASTTRGLRGF
jgi:hypothetical protein